MDGWPKTPPPFVVHYERIGLDPYAIKNAYGMNEPIIAKQESLDQSCQGYCLILAPHVDLF